MMEEIMVQTWEEFQTKLTDISNLRKEWKKKSTLYISDFLYRGQSNSKWGLKTTLERFIHNKISMYEYFKIVFSSKYRIETFTKTSWNISTRQKYKEWLENQTEVFLDEFLSYEYMAYLRHLGFPSPLLDWTSSPYIAAFFAFNEAKKEVSHVSIYIFLEYTGEGKSASSFEPCISSLGEYVKTHKRHFLQQSKYTICTKIEEDGRYYACHEDISESENQDRLWKFKIPIGEKVKVMKILDSYNINSFSLFGSEESLAKIQIM